MDAGVIMTVTPVSGARVHALRCVSRAGARAQVRFSGGCTRSGVFLGQVHALRCVSRAGVSRVASYEGVGVQSLCLNNPPLVHTEARAREVVIKTRPLYNR